AARHSIFIRFNRPIRAPKCEDFMLAHMVIHVTLPAGFSCPGKKTGAEQRRRPFHLTAFTLLV
ncbi:hypothetical protein LMJ14_12510, partial [Klebsiella pneumoniae]|uniref:hypothetical protein n=1 Tax=Klebsiella pneumoniae TaxID=573 RepID=UPI001E41CA33